MSINVENWCVNCEAHCIGNSCPNLKVYRHYCDECSSDARYVIDENDFCAKHAEEHLEALFSELSIDEKAMLLDVDFRDLNFF